jgi:hypothetical protein
MIPRLGIQVAVPADQTMLEALEEAGVGMRPLRAADPGGRRDRRPSRRLLQRRGEGG